MLLSIQYHLTLLVVARSYQMKCELVKLQIPTQGSRFNPTQGGISKYYVVILCLTALAKF